MVLIKPITLKVLDLWLMSLVEARVKLKHIMVKLNHVIEWVVRLTFRITP